MNLIRETQNKAVKTAYWSIVVNIFLAIVKGLSGYFGNSYALIADAIESTTDIFSSMLVVFGLKYSTKPADKNHPYGHGKAEPLITFAVVGFLIISATIIFIESIHNIQVPHNPPKPFTLIVLGAIIILKEIAYRYVNNKGKETNSASLQADAWHHRSDAITSLLALFGISIALILGEGYESADDWAAMLASLFILYNAYIIFRPALAEIMDEHQYDDIIVKIRVSSKKVKGVIETEKCLIRKMGMHYIVDLHIIVDGNMAVAEGHTIAHKVKEQIKKDIPFVSEILIHVEPYNN